MSHANPLRGFLFSRYCKALAMAKGDPMGAAAYASAQPWNDAATIAESITKAAMTAVTLNEAGGQGSVFTDFSEYLRPLTLVGKLPSLHAVPFNVQLIAGTGGARAAWVGEGKPIPVSHGHFEDVGSLAVRKVASIAVMSRDLIIYSKPKADKIIGASVAAALVEEMDRAFIDPSSGETAERPASITHGATQLESSGVTLAAIDFDLRRMVRTLTAANMPLQAAIWVMHPETAVHLSLARGDGGPAYPQMTATGGLLAGLPAVTSQALSAGGSPLERNIVLAEQSQIDLADENGADLQYSNYAALQFDDAPSASAMPLRSLWQEGLAGIKATRYLNWKVRRQGAVVVLRSVSY